MHKADVSFWSVSKQSKTDSKQKRGYYHFLAHCVTGAAAVEKRRAFYAYLQGDIGLQN